MSRASWVLVVGVALSAGCSTAHEATPSGGEPDAGFTQGVAMRPTDWTLDLTVDEEGIAISPNPAVGSHVSVGWGYAHGMTVEDVRLSRPSAERIEADLGWSRASVSNSPLGVEQSWRFEARPAAPVLDIRVPTEGLLFLGTGADGGLTFRTVNQSYLTYSPATWVDANGRRTAISVRYDEGSIEMLVPREVLDASVYPAVLDPVIGSTYTLTPTSLTNSWLDQEYPAVALGTSTRLVVWSDDRISDAPGVYGTFYDEAGTLMQRTGFLIGRGRLTGTPLRPSIAFAQSTYLVSWTSYDGVYAVRVLEDGTVLDNPPITLSLGGSPSTARVDTDGTNFLVAWLNAGTTPGIRARSITPAGVLGGTDASVVLERTSQYRGLSLRRAPSGDYWAVFADNLDGDFDVRAIRLDAAGMPVDAQAIDLATAFGDQSYPDVAFDAAGGGMVVFQDSPTVAIHGTAIATTVGSVTLGISARISSGSESSPTVLRDGSGYRVGWISSAPGAASPQVTRVAGPERMDGITLGAGTTNSLALARQSTGTIHAVWATQNDLTHGYDIFRKTSAGGSNSWSTASPIRVSSSWNEQRSPLVGNNNARFLVVWVQPTFGGERAYAARVNALGEFQDTTPILISPEALQVVVSGVYSNGTDFRVVWHEKDVRTVGGGFLQTTWTRRIRTVADDGSGPTGFTCGPTSSSISPIDVWVDGSRRYVVTYIDGDVIWNRNVGTSTCSGGSGFLAEAASIIDARAMVASRDAVYFLNSAGDLHRVQQTTAMSGSTAVRVPSLPTDMETLDMIPTLGEVLVYSIARPQFPPSQDVGALMFSTSGAVSWHVGNLALNVAASVRPRGSYSDDGVFVVWAASSNAIVGRRLTWTGQAVDPTAVVLASGPRTRDMGDVHTDFLSRSLVVHAARTADTQFVSRIHTQMVDFRFNDGVPNGEACTTGFGCDSGLCVDGVCCATACGFSDPADCQACSQAAGAPTNGTCAPVAAATTCRPAAGECDIVEVCDGAATACPADGFRALDAACGTAATGPCDLADRCTGTSAACQSRALATAGTVCLAANGVCDADDVCNGASAECPVRHRPIGTACRPAATACDASETCDGASADCPADLPASAGAVCRPAFGTCDVADHCDGTSFDCGANVVLAAGETCRPANGDCDAAEACDGLSGTCPVNAFLPREETCRAARGACDVAETCTGASAACPPDLRSISECRAAVGTCDSAEVCDGASDDCPADASATDGTPCGNPLVCMPSECNAGSCIVEPLVCEEGSSCSEEEGGCVAPPARGCTVSVAPSSHSAALWLVALLAMTGTRRLRRVDRLSRPSRARLP